MFIAMDFKGVIGVILILGYSNVVWSQTKGKIVDTKQQPIEGATVVMQLPDSTCLDATISAADGTFTLESEPEDYLLICFIRPGWLKGRLVMPVLLLWNLKTIIWRKW